MVLLKRGDRVIIKLKEDKLTNPYDSEYHDTKILEVIASTNQGYYLFVPQYIFIHDTMRLDKYTCRDWNIPNKYIGDDILLVPESKIYKVFSVLNGMICTQCGDFYDHAAANQPDGSLICWSCRNRT